MKRKEICCSETGGGNPARELRKDVPLWSCHCSVIWLGYIERETGVQVGIGNRFGSILFPVSEQNGSIAGSKGKRRVSDGNVSPKSTVCP